MAHLITGYAGEEHIQSKDQGSFNAAFFGDGQFVMEVGNEFEGSIIDNNTVRILDGDLLMYGRHVRIEPNTYEDLTITTGTAGKNRIDLIVMQYEKDASSGTESAFLQVIKGTESEGTPTAPEFTNGNILEGATINQMPLYKVLVEGVVLSSVTALFRTQPTYEQLAAHYEQEFQEACESYLGSLNILDTKEEIEANTQANQLAGALGVKAITNELSDQLSNSIETKYDEETGQPMWKDKGADTWNFFKSDFSKIFFQNGILNTNFPMFGTYAIANGETNSGGWPTRAPQNLKYTDGVIMAEQNVVSPNTGSILSLIDFTNINKVKIKFRRCKSISYRHTTMIQITNSTSSTPPASMVLMEDLITDKLEYELDTSSITGNKYFGFQLCKHDSGGGSSFIEVEEIIFE